MTVDWYPVSRIYPHELQPGDIVFAPFKRRHPHRPLLIHVDGSTCFMKTCREAGVSSDDLQALGLEVKDVWIDPEAATARLRFKNDNRSWTMRMAERIPKALSPPLATLEDTPPELSALFERLRNKLRSDDTFRKSVSNLEDSIEKYDTAHPEVDRFDRGAAHMLLACVEDVKRILGQGDVENGIKKWVDHASKTVQNLLHDQTGSVYPPTPPKAAPAPPAPPESPDPQVDVLLQGQRSLWKELDRCRAANEKVRHIGELHGTVKALESCVEEARRIISPEKQPKFRSHASLENALQTMRNLLGYWEDRAKRARVELGELSKEKADPNQGDPTP
jgi:hypothetical protein